MLCCSRYQIVARAIPPSADRHRPSVSRGVGGLEGWLATERRYGQACHARRESASQSVTAQSKQQKVYGSLIYADPPQLAAFCKLPPKSELGGVVLDVSDVVDVERQPRKLPRRKSAIANQNVDTFIGKRLTYFQSTMGEVAHTIILVVGIAWLAIEQFLVVLKELRILNVKLLRSKSILSPIEIDVGEDQCVKHHTVNGAIEVVGRPGVGVTVDDTLLKCGERGLILALK